MSGDADPIMEAVETLLVSGYTVELIGNDIMLWLVDKKVLTDGELMALAARLGLMETTGTLQ